MNLFASVREDFLWRQRVRRSLSISPRLGKDIFCCAGLHSIFVQPSAPVRSSAFLTRQKGTKKRPKGLPLWEPLYGKGLCGPYPQWRQAAVTMHPTGHVPPANAAKQVGRKYVWRHLPLRGSRRRHFTVFQYQPPGRQPFGLKVKSPRAFGPAPLPEGGPWGDRPKAYPGGKRQPRTGHDQWRAGLTGPSRSLSLRRTAHSFTRGRAEAWSRPRNQWRAKPEPPCTPFRL